MKFDIFISDNTKKHLSNALNSNSHAFVVETQPGNQFTQSNAYIEHTVGVKPGTSIIIEPKDKSISIDQIRALRLQFSLRNSNNQTRLIFINKGQILTHEAQNALLKILEEPPLGTKFIINTDSSNALLPTVLSRSVLIVHSKPEYESVSDYFIAKGHKIPEIKSALAISDGWPELAEIILDKESSELLDELNYAKSLLNASLTQKLRDIDTLTKNKQRIPLLLFALERLAKSANTAHILSKGAVSERWSKILDATYQAQDLSKNNVNSRLMLTGLMLKIS